MKTKTDAELIEEAEKLDFSDLLPFEMVQGDTIKRLHPHSTVVLNSSATWLVSQQARAAHKMRAKPAEIEQALALIPELASRLKAANELGEQILGNIKGLLCERDDGAPTERNLELAKLIVEWDKRSDDGVRND